MATSDQARGEREDGRGKEAGWGNCVCNRFLVGGLLAFPLSIDTPSVRQQSNIVGLPHLEEEEEEEEEPAARADGFLAGSVYAIDRAAVAVAASANLIMFGDRRVSDCGLSFVRRLGGERGGIFIHWRCLVCHGVHGGLVRGRCVG